MEQWKYNHDGWVLKVIVKERSIWWWLLESFRTRRKEVIEYFENDFSKEGKGSWAKARRRGEYKIAKVNLIEVDKLEMLENLYEII